jgi:uncharacterized repeat protein (TIGR01451 family)
VRSSNVARPAPRRAIVGFFTTVISFALLFCGIAAADSVTTNFEPTTFHIGTVNGQPGNGQPSWKSAPPGSIPACNPNPTGGAYDQSVVSNSGAPAAFGLQSLRMSNLCGNGEFFYQTYSAPVTSPAGENHANTEFIGQFSFIPKTSEYQPGLFMSVSPDSFEGSRMSWVGLEDTPNGIQVSVSDTPNVDGDFANYDAGAPLSRTAPHTIRFWIKVNPGVDNDLVRISIDGRDVGQCFTTWENYYRTAPEQAPPPNVNTPASIRSLQFRTSVQGPAELATTGGYLFDNVSVTTANGPGPPGCDVTVDKKADAPTVNAAARAGYQITVRNRGHATVRDVRVCDRIPRRMTFVHADRTMTRVGRARCFLIARLAAGQRVSAHVQLAVDANAPQGTVTNIADVTPGVAPPGSPTNRADLPGTVRSASRALRPLRRARAVVRVLARRAARRPKFTG